MPKAVTNITPERKDLKTCAGGYVEIRRMPYGAWLHRQDIAMQMTMSMDAKDQSGEGALKMQAEATTAYEFGQCIIDHNLFEDDEETVKLDFAKDGLSKLDAQIGNEISQYITELHEYDLGN